MRSKLMLCLLAFAVAGCMDDGESSPPTAPGADTTVVYESGPHLRQCSPVEITPAQSAAKLTSAGIEARNSSCGHLEGVAFPAMCGAGTGEILLHEINEADLAAAKAAGFSSADEIGQQRPGTGWRRAECAQYIHAIEVAQSSTSCADVRNRVLQIQDAARPDQRVVLLDQAGSCADASYRQVLYGDEGDNVLCSNSDSIAGPQKSCRRAARAQLFDTIVANLDREDLGLGTGYNVSLVYTAD